MKYIKQYSVNQNYFDLINTEDKAYFLGLMASDGCITNKNRLLIGLAKEDEEVLELFKNSIAYTGPLYNVKGRTIKHKDQIRLQIRNSTLFNSLINLGIVERKSLILTFPNETLVPKNLQCHFIRGYFDGDGSVKFNHDSIHIRFTGTFDILDSIQNIFINNCAVSKLKMYQANKQRNTYEFTYGGDMQGMRIYDYMYKDATIFMKRKKDKFNSHWSKKFSVYYPTFILQEELQRRITI
jgi:hypothetical protein